MPLSNDDLERLKQLKSEIEDILEDIGGILPDDFRMTCVLRYCGDNPDISNMIWTDDYHGDVITALEDEMKRVA